MDSRRAAKVVGRVSRSLAGDVSGLRKRCQDDEGARRGSDEVFDALRGLWKCGDRQPQFRLLTNSGADRRQRHELGEDCRADAGACGPGNGGYTAPSWTHNWPRFKQLKVLIFLDANIVQYCADEEEFILGKSDACKTADPNLRKELVALRRFRVS